MSHMIQLFLWGAFSQRTRKQYRLKTCAPLSSRQPYSRSPRLGSRPGAQQGTNGEGTWAIATQWQTTQRERSEEHTSELQSRQYLVCRLLLEKKNEERRQARHRGLHHL